MGTIADLGLVTATEAGAILNTSRDSILRWAANPKHPLQGYRAAGRQVLFHRADIERLRDQQRGAEQTEVAS
jgi:excisionase family DNA binding protein